MQRLLILGGTTEASALAASLAGDSRFETLLSFAGTTRAPRPPPVPYRVGGFGGAAGLAEFIRHSGIDLLIDATHPFAARMKRNAAEAAAMTDVKLLGILRPPWQAEAGDNWRSVADMAQAAQALGSTPRRVLLTIGQKDLPEFQAAPWHHYVVRSVDPPDPGSLPPNAVVISARGPFRQEDEAALLRDHRIDLIVTKNSGGTATQPKLAAARAAGIGVVIVDRPPPPVGVRLVDDANAALEWLAAHA